jgi:hypothetical protein
VPCLPLAIGNCTPILYFLIASLYRVPQARFLGLIKKAHPTSAINARLINAPHRTFRPFACFYCASGHA